MIMKQTTYSLWKVSKKTTKTTDTYTTNQNCRWNLGQGSSQIKKRQKLSNHLNQTFQPDGKNIILDILSYGGENLDINPITPKELEDEIKNNILK